MSAEEPSPAPPPSSPASGSRAAGTEPAPPADVPGPERDGPPADAAESDERAGEFGRPGPPLNRRNPFLIGFVGGLGVLLAYATFLGLRNAASILVLIFIALFLAIGLNPAVSRLRAWGVPRGGAVAIVALTVVALVAGGLIALIPPLVTQTSQLVDNVPDFIQRLQRNETLNNLIERYDILTKVQNAVNAGTVGNVFGGVVGGAKLVFGTIFNVLTVLVLTIYFMAAFERIKEGAYALVPATRRNRVRLGALAIAVLAGASTFVFGLIVGLPYPFALAVVVAVCDLIPQIGATLGAIIVSLVGLSTSLTTAIICVVFFIVYQQLENYLIYPTVMRRSVKVSDVAAIVAALLGVSLFGVIGALVAIPMVAGIQLIMREVMAPTMQDR
jgi:predicted PurR-regulated permease PerM